MRPLIIFTFIFINCHLWAQDPCGFDSTGAWITNQGPLNPEVEFQSFIPEHVNESSYTAQELCENKWRPYTLPVVFHVVHPTADFQIGMGSNLPDSVIQKALRWVNDAFRNRGFYSGNPSNTNPFVRSVDTRIQFAFIRKDDQNKNLIFNANSGTGAAGICRWPTNEVSRIAFAKQAHDSLIDHLNSQIQWIGAVNPMKTIQIIVVDSIYSTHLGYTFSRHSKNSNYRNVVVIEDDVLNDQNRVKHLVHQLGHLLGLYHIFSPSCSDKYGDGVEDTPIALKPTFPFQTGRNSCNEDLKYSPFTVDQPDLYENYMDFSPVKYQNTFTKGQIDQVQYYLKYRMDSLLHNKRWINPFKRYASIDAYISNAVNGYICQGISTQIKITNLGQLYLDSVQIIRYDNALEMDTIRLRVDLHSGKSAWFELPSFNIGTGDHGIEVVGGHVNPQEPIIWESDRLCRLFRLFPTKIDTAVGFEKNQNMYHFYSGQHSPWSIDSIAEPRLKFDSYSWQDTNSSYVLISNPVNLSDFNSAFFEFEHSFLLQRSDKDLTITLEFSSDCFKTSPIVVEIPYENLTYNKSQFCGQDFGLIRTDLEKLAGKAHVQLKMTLSCNLPDGISWSWPYIHFDNFKWILGNCPSTSDMKSIYSTCQDSALINNPTGRVIQWSNCDTSNQTVFPLGKHWVERMSSTGCFLSDTFVVQSYPKHPNHSIIRSGDTLFSTIDSSVNSLFNWYLDDELLTTTTNHFLVVSQKGTYSIQYVDSNGCTSKSNRISVLQLLVKEELHKLTISPNPSGGIVNISGNTPIQFLEVSDVTGKDIATYQRILNSNERVIRLEASNGVYLLSVFFEDGSIVNQKIVLNKL